MQTLPNFLAERRVGDGDILAPGADGTLGVTGACCSSVSLHLLSQDRPRQGGGETVRTCSSSWDDVEVVPI